MVYAAVSKTAGCNDHVGSNPSPGTNTQTIYVVIAFGIPTHLYLLTIR